MFTSTQTYFLAIQMDTKIGDKTCQFLFCLQVAWEVRTPQESQESVPRSATAYDLFLLGSVMPGVKSMPAWRRPSTQTYVYCFDGTNNGTIASVLTNGFLNSDLS